LGQVGGESGTIPEPAARVICSDCFWFPVFRAAFQLAAK